MKEKSWDITFSTEILLKMKQLYCVQYMSINKDKSKIAMQ